MLPLSPHILEFLLPMLVWNACGRWRETMKHSGVWSYQSPHSGPPADKHREWQYLEHFIPLVLHSESFVPLKSRKKKLSHWGFHSPCLHWSVRAFCFVDSVSWIQTSLKYVSRFHHIFNIKEMPSTERANYACSSCDLCWFDVFWKDLGNSCTENAETFLKAH